MPNKRHKTKAKDKAKAFEHIDVVVYAPKVLGEQLYRGKMVRLQSAGKDGNLMDLKVLSPIQIDDLLLLQPKEEPKQLATPDTTS